MKPALYLGMLGLVGALSAPASAEVLRSYWPGDGGCTYMLKAKIQAEQIVQETGRELSDLLGRVPECPGGTNVSIYSGEISCWAKREGEEGKLRHEYKASDISGLERAGPQLRVQLKDGRKIDYSFPDEETAETASRALQRFVSGYSFLRSFRRVK